MFTSSGTEAVNTAIFGAHGHVVTTAVEHSCVREAIARAGTEVTIVEVDRSGRFTADEVVDAVRDDTVLVSVQLANHEVGTVQPVSEVCAALRDRRVRVHVDASAGGRVRASGVRRRSVLRDGAQVGGPLGAGALLVRRGVRIPALPPGGRAGTSTARRYRERAGMGRVRRRVRGRRPRGEPDQRELIATAAAVCESVPGWAAWGRRGMCPPEPLVPGRRGSRGRTDPAGARPAGIAVHSGSACSSETLEPSPVLTAMGVDAERSHVSSAGPRRSPTWPVSSRCSRESSKD